MRLNRITAASPFPSLLVFCFLVCTVAPASAHALPLQLVWTGIFEDGAGPFNNLDFSIVFTIDDPTTPDLASSSGATYFVEALLTIDGAAVRQSVNLDLAGFTDTTAGLGAFTDILVPGDSMFFGICTGGSCNDPSLWNSEPFAPVLFTGVFPLGIDSSCTFPGPCDNAIANYFDGAGGGVTTRYQGTLVVSAVPIPGAALMLISALAGLPIVGRR